MSGGVSVVVPTLGRPSLAVLLTALAAGRGPSPLELVVVDDRRGADAPPMDVPPVLGSLDVPVRVVRSGGRGPAAARNAGWRCSSGEWVAFLDDDVVPGPSWRADLAEDLGTAPADVAGVQGRVRVPLPQDRGATDWERGTAALADGWWITADMAYRRAVLDQVGGFDERFTRAFREDSDLALRVLGSGHRLARGRREVCHPVRPVDRWVSVRVQAGNADDVLMRRVHGRGWRERAHAAPGRRTTHALGTAAAAGTALLLLAGRPRLAAVPAFSWMALTARFAWERIAPGPRTPGETATMVMTSALIGPAATAHWLRGMWVHRDTQPWTPSPAVADNDGPCPHPTPLGEPSPMTHERPPVRRS